MKQTRQTILVACLALCGLAATFSCSDSDDPNAENPLASAIGGKTWWADYHQDGEYT
jgi:hypothetical protein